MSKVKFKKSMTHFTSGSLGEVKTPVNILKEFLATFNRRQKCKAAILSWLDGRHYYGQDWIRVTFETLADALGYCRETISKHMRELIEMGLVECDRSQLFPKDTACVYQINQSKLIESLEISRCEKINIDERKNSHVSENNFATYISNSKSVKSQQQAASKKGLEPDWDAIEEQTEYGAQAQSVAEQSSFEEVTVTSPTKNVNRDSKTNSINYNLDRSSAADDEDEEKPTSKELRDIYQQLREIPCTPAFKLNNQIQATVAKHWSNVPGAIAYLKEAIRTWKRVESPEAVFIKACKQGNKPENWGKPKVSYPQPSDEQLAQLSAAKSQQTILDYYQHDGLWMVETGRSVLAWWEAMPQVKQQEKT